jgi:hypothetical protein
MAWWKPLIFSLLLALLAYSLWWLELTYRIGWEADGWLSYTPYSVFGIAALLVVAYLLPIGMALQTAQGSLLQAGIELYFVTLAAYFLERLILITQYTQFYGFFSKDGLLIVQIVVLAMTAWSFYLITQRWIQPLRWQQSLVLGAAMTLPYPLSLLFIQPLFNFSDQNSFSDAVKMGYPFFWIVLLMGVAGLFTTKFLHKTHTPAGLEDILDDLPEE